MKGQVWGWVPCSKERYEAQKKLAELHEEKEHDIYTWDMAKFNRYFKIENGRYFEYQNQGMYDTERNQLV